MARALIQGQGGYEVRRLLVGLVAAILLMGCAAQKVIQREFYPPDEATLQVREEISPEREA